MSGLLSVGHQNEDASKVELSANAPPDWLKSFNDVYVSKRALTEPPRDVVPMAIEALRYAHDIRKFEIDLYWKRSAYFQTVLGVILGALALTLKSSDPAGAKSSWVIDVSILQATILYLGSVLAFAWYAATRGGKYWQRNWETHVDVLEDRVTGPLYKTVYSHVTTGKSDLLNVLNEYPYSTSKLNSFVSLIFLALFLAGQFIFFFSSSAKCYCFDMSRTPFLVAFSISLATMWLMHRFTTFDVADEKSPHHINAVQNTRKFKTTADPNLDKNKVKIPEGKDKADAASENSRP